MTLTPQQEVACQARNLLHSLKRVPPCELQSLLMGMLIYSILEVAGVSLTCEQLVAGGAQYACLPRQDQLPALIWAIVNFGGGGGGSGSVLSGIGPPASSSTPSIATPAQSTAIYFDTANPGQPNVWYWANNAWTEFIGD
jgi:hypothetical protein